MRTNLIVSALCLVAFLVSPAAGGEGRQPVWEPLSLGPGQAGKFVLTQDVPGASGPVIQISGSGIEDVEIDLNGYRTSLPGGVSTPAIDVENVRSFAIRNGVVDCGPQCSIAVQTTGVEQVIIEDLVIFGGNVSIRLFNPKTFAVRRNVALDAAGAGSIIVHNIIGFTAPAQGVIEDNRVRNGGQIGIYLQGFGDHFRSTTIRNNRVERANTGILASGRGLIVSGNDVTRSINDGIVVLASSGCQVHDNVSTANGDAGIHIGTSTDNCRVFENAASGNGESGIDVSSSSRNLFTHNVLHNNGQAGIAFDASSADNTYGENSGRGNSVAPGACSANPPACGAPQICDDGTGNVTLGDNLLPGAC